VILFGVILFLGGGSLVGVSYWPRVRATNWNLYKPDWWLVFDSSSENRSVAEDAINILVDRYGRDELSQSTVDTLIERGLEAQADTQGAWLPSWGNLIEDAWRKDALSDEEKGRYVRRAVSIEMKMRDRIWTSSVAPIYFVVTGVRCGDGRMRLSPYPAITGPKQRANPDFGLVLDIPNFDIDGKPATMDDYLEEPDHWYPITWYPIARMNIPAKMSLPGITIRSSGQHRISVRMKVKGVVNLQRALDDWSHPLKGVHASEPIEMNLSTTVMVVPEDQKLIQMVADPSLKEVIKKAVRIFELRIDKNGVFFNTVLIGQVPVKVAFMVFVRDQSGREWECGRVYNSREHEIRPVVSGFVGSKADIILRSSAEVAMRDADITSIWDGEIVIKDATVKREDGGL